MPGAFDAGPQGSAKPGLGAPEPLSGGGLTVSLGGDPEAGKGVADYDTCALTNIPALANFPQVLDAGTSIANRVPCDYKLAVAVQRAELLHVEINGERYALGNGWTLKDEMHTVVPGDACDVLRDQ